MAARPLLLALALLAPGAAQAQQSAAEPKSVNSPYPRFYYKLGTVKGAVLTVYVTGEFYELYIWEKETLLAPVFAESQAKNKLLATIALRDAKSGKTVGTYSPKDGLSML
ncbi:hypothetical protein GCM10010960_17550 [Arenimonas maotaiensis]|uniref:Thiol:disulfide interchange protein DsbD N-terminal domain-containing protein n=1 Tax=Arenimonas maotaiensis TaxID=1446479 RepID=A0A917CQQ9_9GAMM|nr:hypothetical protein [Arenimonas maotaiensis]GGF96380.1 hypothetical protein GCM10010960_17550 [Arenimonas maotaiensis]